MIWLILVPLALLAAVGVALPLLRPGPAVTLTEGAVPDAAKARLAELQRQLADGELSEAEAAALRLEVQRRILAEARAGEAAARPLGQRGLKLVGAAVALSVLVGAGLLYGLLGRPDLSSPTAAVAARPDGQLDRMIAALEAQVRETPDDVEMWGVLGQAYSQARRYDRSAAAYARAAVLAPDNAQLHAALGEALVQSAGGVVTDEALVAIQAAAERDPADPRARYFLALRKDQTGDRDGAMDDWIALLNDAPPNAPWAPQVRALVQEVASEQGIDISDRLDAPAG